ncbi:late embryogenesis abundant protein, group 3 isoform X2 [Cannabis sativa]|uniref:Late embryogenesis abundant protein n=1 Tax=Cannabis sativa TaxID=3483 RepID=A0A7J6H0S9_CANSA|nr:late embryogenesis abundant protein, group 3 isoform X2 [Cannabis sativa]KAF4388804.1 hypothetical protein F8388_018983 [Cannabis sativa]
MATKFLTKNIFLNLSTALPQAPAFKPSLATLKVSRVCYTSSSRYSKGRNAAEESRGSRSGKVFASAKQDAGFNTDDITKRAEEDIKKTKETAQDLSDSAKGYADETKKKAEGAAASLGDKAKEVSARAGENAEAAKENIMGAAESAKEKAKEGGEKLAENVESAKESLKDAAESAVDKAKETGQKLKDAITGDGK